jgi:hypothetical protein
MEHGDEVHGDRDRHVMMIKCSTWKRRKRKTKNEMIKAKVYDRFLFGTQDTIEGVSACRIDSRTIKGENLWLNGLWSATR